MTRLDPAETGPNAEGIRTQITPDQRQRPLPHYGRRRLIDHAAALRRIGHVDCARTLDKWAMGCPDSHASYVAEAVEIAVDPLTEGAVGLRLLDDTGKDVVAVFLHPRNL